MRLKLFGATVLSLGILAGACANAPTGDGPGDGGTGSSGSTGGSGSTGPTSPTGSDQLVLRIEQVGGFVAVQYNLTRMPMFSLYADGLVVMPGAQTDIYPGPALPALAQQRLSPDAIKLLLQAATDAGLDKDRDLRTMTVSDAPTTVFTLTIDGQTHTTQVYALDFDLSSKPDGMSQEEFQARKDLAAFEAKASDLSWLPDGSVTDEGMYQPTALRIFSSPYQPDPELTQALHRMAPDARAGSLRWLGSERAGRDALRHGRRRRGGVAPAARRTGQPAHTVDERRHAVRTVVPTPPPRRVGLLI